MTGIRIREYKDSGMQTLTSDEVLAVAEHDDSETTQAYITEAIQRGVTPKRLAEAYRKGGVNIMCGDTRVYRNMLTALAKRWGIDRNSPI